MKRVEWVSRTLLVFVRCVAVTQIFNAAASSTVMSDLNGLHARTTCVDDNDDCMLVVAAFAAAAPQHQQRFHRLEAAAFPTAWTHMMTGTLAAADDASWRAGTPVRMPRPF